MRFTRLPVLVTLFAALLIVGLTSTALTRPLPTQAPRSAFTREVDEPSTRGRLTRISPEDMDVYGPFSLSPDGEWLVFPGRSSGAASRGPLELFKIKADGSGAPLKLTAGGDESVAFPAFSPTGEQIYFSQGGRFWRVGAAGSAARGVVPGSGLAGDCCGDVSRDEKLVFTSCSQVGERSYVFGKVVDAVEAKCLIWVCNTDGTELTQYREGWFPKWSRDGKRISFVYDDDLWVMGLNGGELTQVTSTAGVVEALPSFSPDDSSLVYVSNEGSNGKGGTSWNIWTIRLDGRAKSQLTQLRGWDSYPVWTKAGVYFLSARGSTERRVQRVWRIAP
jgi:Tol biopolymer transport system component